MSLGFENMITIIATFWFLKSIIDPTALLDMQPPVCGILSLYSNQVHIDSLSTIANAISEMEKKIEAT